MRYFLLSWFIIPLIAHSQPLTVGDPAFVGVYGSGSFAPNSPGALGATYWYVALDLTNNAHATNWIDRIHAHTYNDTATGYPSNMSDGLHFSAAQSTTLTNQSPLDTYSGESTHWVIINATNSPAGKCWVASNQGSGFQLLDFNLSSKPDVQLSSTLHPVSVAVQQNSFFDLAWISDTNANTLTCYTNGVLAGTLSSLTLTKTNWDLICLEAGPVAFGGIIKEIAIWSTNSESSGNMTSLHNYATNKYGYSP